jgi:hypothetical protein
VNLNHQHDSIDEYFGDKQGLKKEMIKVLKGVIKAKRGLIKIRKQCSSGFESRLYGISDPLFGILGIKSPSYRNENVF